MGKIVTLIRKTVLAFASSRIAPPSIRNRILNRLIGEVNLSAEICGGSFFTGNRIHIGENAFINNFCRFYSHIREGSEIFIGKNVVIAMGCTLTTHTHIIGNSGRRAPRDTELKPIIIEEGCWIGANVTVLPGVRIGKGTVVGAGSVVIHDLDENSVYVGNPARKVKQLSK